MKKLNIVVIGTGMYACGRGTEGYGTVMPAICEWKKTRNIGMVYVAGRSLKSARAAKSRISELARKMGIRLTVKYLPGSRTDAVSYKQAIREAENPACAIVVVPDEMHSKVAGDSISGGLHTLVVKPLAPTLREVIKLVELQKRNNVHCAVEFHKRFDSANMKLKDVIESGTIGDPLYFLAEFSQRKSMPTKIFKKWVKTTDIFQYLGIHYIDIIYFATHAIPVRAMALGQKNWLASQGIDTYDSIEAIIEWKLPSGKKFVSCILTNWIDPESTSSMSDQKIKVIGTKGRFESDQKRRGITIVTDENGIEEPNPYFSAAYGAEGDIEYKGYGIESIHRFLDDVMQVEEGRIRIGDLKDKRPTFEQSIIPTAILETVHKSLKRRGEWVDVKSRI